MGMRPESVVAELNPRIGRQAPALSVILPCYNQQDCPNTIRSIR